MYHLHFVWLLLKTWLANLTSRTSVRPHGRKILILTSGKLGDLVCMTSLYGAIHRQLGVTVDVVSNHFGSELYAGNPVIGKVHVLGQITPAVLAKELYSHAVLLNPNPELVALAVRAGIPYRISVTTPRENFLTRVFERFLQERHVYRFDQQAVEFYQTMLGIIGLKLEVERRTLFPSTADQQRANVFWQEHGLPGKFVVAMCLGAGKAYKLWPVERFAAVADFLVEQYGAKILLVGSSADRDRSAALVAVVKHREAMVDAAGKFKLLEQAAVLKLCRLFVSVDTGPLYIADAMGVPVVDIAGPADCVTQHPIGRYKILHPDNKEQYGDMAVAFHSGSENEARYRKMTEAISVKQVTTAIDELIQKHQLVNLQANKLPATS